MGIVVFVVNREDSNISENNSLFSQVLSYLGSLFSKSSTESNLSIQFKVSAETRTLKYQVKPAYLHVYEPI